ncbi:SAM-dependent methyltransferase [Bacteroidia bacterium]|nr:SAM-dependent methyltransferase [Bacteroidia bacterium]
MDATNVKFWSRYATIYDFEINNISKDAYNEMYRLMSSVLKKDMDVLEVATGTGLIATHIAGYVKSVIATDFSRGMIEKAKKKPRLENLQFSIEDATALSFPNDKFDAVIISNALHIMPNPEAALANIKRVLKPNGLLIAPNFSHGHLRGKSWNLSAAILKLFGFVAYSKWLPAEYVQFISLNGFSVDKWMVLKAAFPLVYLQARNLD